MKVLDLFCGAGGAATGIHRALPNAEIIGVDIRPQKHYPFTFVLADAMTFPLEGYDFIWASPPCQRYSAIQHITKNKEKYPELIGPIKKLLETSGSPFVIENVEGAPLRVDLRLCGSCFGLGMIRHRIFESNRQLPLLTLTCHHESMYDPWHWGNRQREEMSKRMGIDWEMTRQEVREAIPPAYSEFIVRQIFHLRGD